MTEYNISWTEKNKPSGIKNYKRYQTALDFFDKKRKEPDVLTATMRVFINGHLTPNGRRYENGEVTIITPFGDYKQSIYEAKE